MGDIPLAVVTATIWTYWIAVGAMVARLRRKTHKMVGVIPEQRVEKFMWLAFVPMVVAWMTVPILAMRTHGPFAIGSVVHEITWYATLRWVAATVAVVALAATAKCWARMGKAWRMDVSTSQPTELITDGLFTRIRHPIYAFSIVLMLATLAIVPTWPMLIVAVVHNVLMNLKARNEERHLLATQGEAYRRYFMSTGRFFPHLFRRGAWRQ